MVVASLAFLQGAAWAEEDPQARYDRGVKALEADDYKTAYEELAAAYEADKRPATRLLMARARLGLGERAAAYNDLLAVEEEASATDAPTAERARTVREGIAPQIAVVTILPKGKTEGPVHLTVGGQPAKVGQPFAVEPGRVRIKVLVTRSVLGGPELVNDKEVELAAGDTKTLQLTATLRDPCRDKPACARIGACSTMGDTCVAESAADCKASKECKQGARCSLDKKRGRCVNYSKGRAGTPWDSPTYSPSGSAEPQRKPSGVGLLVAGGIFTGLGGLNLVTAPICKTDLVDPTVQDTCLYASLGLGAGLGTLGIALIVGGTIQRNEYKKSKFADAIPIEVTASPEGVSANFARSF